MTINHKHTIFENSKRKHILLITNHGCHSPVIEVTTDTGGQNFYVNDFALALVKLGYKITILNRGGYNHPVTKAVQKGIHYYDKIWNSKGKYCRLIYLEDGHSQFINKENLKEENIEAEKNFFLKIVKKEGLNLKNILFISTHYWDAGILGMIISDYITKKHKIKIPHIWTPHSLAILKKKNYKNAPKEILKPLNFPYRIRQEKRIIQTVDGVVSTSNKIKETLAEYKCKVKNHFWFPPGLYIENYKPRTIKECADAIKVLQKAAGLNRSEVKNILKTKLIFLEVSRSAKPKRKDLVVKSFLKSKSQDNSVLVMTIDPKTAIYNNVKKLISSFENIDNKKNIFLLEHFLTHSEIEQLFSLANVYVTASIMEGWGMSVQQAAASRCAIISSKFVPFAIEILRDNALVVHKNYSRIYAEKIDILHQEPHLRNLLASKAYKVATEYSWTSLSETLINKMKTRKFFNGD